MPLGISSYLYNSLLAFLHILAGAHAPSHSSRRSYNPALPCLVYQTEVSRDQTQGNLNNSLLMIVVHTSNVLSMRWVTQSSKAEPTNQEIENLRRISARPQVDRRISAPHRWGLDCECTVFRPAVFGDSSLGGSSTLFTWSIIVPAPHTGK